MDNEIFSPDNINAIKDDVEYYIDAYEDPDFMPDDTLYDAFELPEDSDSDSEYDGRPMMAFKLDLRCAAPPVRASLPSAAAVLNR